MAQKPPKYVPKTVDELYRQIDRINKQLLRANKAGLKNTGEFKKAIAPIPGLSYHYNKEGVLQFDKGKKALASALGNKAIQKKLDVKDKFKTKEVKAKLDRDIEDYMGTTESGKVRITPTMREQLADDFSKLHDMIVNEAYKFYSDVSLKEAVHRKGQVTAEEARKIMKMVKEYKQVEIKDGKVKINRENPFEKK